MASKDDVESAKREIHIRELRLKEKLNAWNEYVTFAVSKVGGLAAVVCGGLDVVNPSIIQHLPHPEMVLGGGLALLTGKSVLNIIAKSAKVFGGD